MEKLETSRIIRRMAQKHGVSAVLLEWLASEQRSPHRKGPRGVNVRFRDALQREVDGQGVGALDAGSVGVDAIEHFTLQELRLQNFGPFRDTKIHFRMQPGRPVCLIEANNGHGKSHVIKGLLYLLGVDKAPQSSFKYPGRLLHHGAPSHDPTIRIQLLMESSLVGRFELRRQVRFSVQGGEPRKQSDERHVNFLDGAGGEGGDLHGADAERWITERFPPEIIEYFVFDAESSPISELSGELGERVPSMQGPVERVLGISVLRDAAKRCRGDQVRGYFQSEHRQVTTDSTPRQLQRQLEEHQERVESLVRERSELQREHRELGADLERARSVLQQIEQAKESRPGGDRAAVELAIARAETELAAIRDQIAQRVRRDLPLGLLEPLLRRLAAERTPENAGREWMAGARFSLQRVASRVARGQLPWAEKQDRSEAEIFSELLGSVGIPSDGASRGAARFDPAMWVAAARACEAPSGLLAGLAGKAQELETLQAQLRDLPRRDTRHEVLKQYREAGAKVESFQRLRTALDGQIEHLDDEITEAEAEVERLDAAIPEIRRRRQQASRLDKLVKLIDKVARALDASADELRKARLSDIEQHASTLLREITNKPGSYHRIAFDTGSCRFQLLNPAGEEVPPDRSTGEKTVLALAIVHGLRQVADSRLPLVIEAPLRPLDPAHELGVARHHLAQIEEHTVLMEVPGRLDGQLMAELRPRIGQRFVLVQQPGSGASVAEERALQGGPHA
jgi:DNA sulfur modification protein DndD